MSDIEDVAAWRRHLHAHPELAYQERETAAFVAEKLRSFGVDELHEGIGRTGLVAVIHGRGGPAGSASERIALRADMDALPIVETSNLAWSSRNEGRMHACGHDGHTAMLLGAARELARTRDFAGSAVLIFQPAEEDGAGMEAMLKDGLLDRFPVRAAYGMHINPGQPIGQFATRTGPFFGSTCEFYLRVLGRGGHAAYPNDTADPVVALAHIIVAAQTIIARNVPPPQTAVVTVAHIAGGSATNIIPDETRCTGTIRAFSAEMQTLAKTRLRAIAEGIARAMGCQAELRLEDGYPVLVNDADATARAVAAAADVVGADAVDTAWPAWPGAEDFAYISHHVPAAYVLIGNGDSAPLHHPGFDFADAALPHGIAWWRRLVERELPA